MLSNRSTALVCGDIGLEGDDTRNWLDGGQIDTDDEAVHGHALGGDLTPRSGGSAKIQQDLALLEEAILLVQLYELKSGSGSVALFLGKFVPLVKTTLSSLLLETHLDEEARVVATKASLSSVVGSQKKDAMLRWGGIESCLPIVAGPSPRNLSKFLPIIFLSQSSIREFRRVALKKLTAKTALQQSQQAKPKKHGLIRKAPTMPTSSPPRAPKHLKKRLSRLGPIKSTLQASPKVV